MRRLTISERNMRYPASALWLLTAILRLQLRKGAEQLKLGGAK